MQGGLYGWTAKDISPPYMPPAQHVQRLLRMLFMHIPESVAAMAVILVSP